MNKTVPIAFDLDETLIELLPTWQKHLFRLYGPDSRIRNTSFRIQTVNNLTDDKIERALCFAINDTPSIEATQGAYELLYHLQQVYDGGFIRVITARDKSRFKYPTYEVVNRLFPGIRFDIVFAPSSEKIFHLARIDYFVEDRRKTAYQLAACGKKVFLLDRLYNSAPPHKNLVRIKSLMDIVDRLK